MQVDAAIDEADVGRIRTGQKASFTVDAFPGQTFEGEVRQVRKAAQNVANVVTYVAVVGFSNAGDRLLPGMTANVRVVTESRENVLKVPNAALRVRIAGVEPRQRRPARRRAPRHRPRRHRARPPAAPAAGAGSARPSPSPRAVAGGGGMAALRERLVTELQLTPTSRASWMRSPPRCGPSSWHCATSRRTSAPPPAKRSRCRCAARSRHADARAAREIPPDAGAGGASRRPDGAWQCSEGFKTIANNDQNTLAKAEKSLKNDAGTPPALAGGRPGASAAAPASAPASTAAPSVPAAVATRRARTGTRTAPATGAGPAPVHPVPTPRPSSATGWWPNWP